MIKFPARPRLDLFVHDENNNEVWAAGPDFPNHYPEDEHRFTDWPVVALFEFTDSGNGWGRGVEKHAEILATYISNVSDETTYAVLCRIKSEEDFLSICQVSDICDQIPKPLYGDDIEIEEELEPVGENTNHTTTLPTAITTELVQKTADELNEFASTNEIMDYIDGGEEMDAYISEIADRLTEKFNLSEEQYEELCDRLDWQPRIEWILLPPKTTTPQPNPPATPIPEACGEEIAIGILVADYDEERYLRQRLLKSITETLHKTNSPTELAELLVESVIATLKE